MQFRPGEMILHGWVLSQTGQPVQGVELMEGGLNDWRKFSVSRHYPHCLGMLASAYGALDAPEKGLTYIEEALAAADERNERYFEAELYRIKGELALRSQFPLVSDQAEMWFSKAIEVARCQNAKSWELRATLSLSKLLAQRGWPEEACSRLKEIYAWFSEGWNSKNLIQARQLLNDLA